MASRQTHLPESTLYDNQAPSTQRSRGYTSSTADQRPGYPSKMSTVYENVPLSGPRPAHLLPTSATTPSREDAAKLISLPTQSSAWGRGAGTYSHSHSLTTPNAGEIGKGANTPNTAASSTAPITTPLTKRGERSDTGIDTTIIPRPEPSEIHPQQLCPPPSVFQLAETVYHHPSSIWRIQDFTTPGTSEGTSVLASLLVDYICSTLRQDCTLSERFTIASQAVVTSPRRLLDMLQSKSAATNFASWALLPSTKLPPTLPRQLCPNLTPGLILNEHTRARVDQPSLLRGDRITIANYFIQCYYPSSAGSSMTRVLQSYKDEELVAINKTPGLFAQKMSLRNRDLIFDPPKWYRLSVNPANPPASAFTDITQAHYNTPPESIHPTTSMNLSIQELRGLPFPQQRTAFLSILPKLLEGLTTPDGLNEAFTRINGASAQELLHYTNIDVFIKTFLPTTLVPATDHIEAPSLPLYICNISLRHRTPSSRGGGHFWNVAPETILKQWIDAVLPLLVANNHRMHIIHSPYDRLTDDRELHLDAEISTSLQFYVYNIRSPKRLQSLDFWVKTTCPNLQDLPSTSKMGPHAPSYVSAMTAASIWVDIIISFQDGVLPCIMLEGSIDRDSDNIITLELLDRLSRHGLSLPPDIFYTSTCIVSNANNRAAVTVKCLLAKTTEASTVQTTFARLAEKTMTDRYLVTGGYMFEGIAYHADDKADRRLTAAISRQQDFLNSLTKTILLGFDNIDPYCYVPPYTMDIVTSVISPNTKSLASLLLHISSPAPDGSLLPSPVINVTTNEERTRIFLTADRQDASQLLVFTADIIPLMKVWMGPSVNITCAVDEARNHATTQPTTPGQHKPTLTPSTISIADSFAPAGSTNTHTHLAHSEDSGGKAMPSNPSTTTMDPSFHNDFHTFCSSVEQKLHTLTTVATTSLSKEDILETISTLVDSNLNSSLSSI